MVRMSEKVNGRALGHMSYKKASITFRVPPITLKKKVKCAKENPTRSWTETFFRTKQCFLVSNKIFFYFFFIFFL
jgi:hypothetical protein